MRNLEIALVLRDLLIERGFDVVMTRTTQDVRISNAERAEIASDAGADLYVRIHADGNEESESVHGVSVLVPGRMKGMADAGIVVPSARAGRLVLDALVRSTGASNRGLRKRTNLVGFNWSRVPSVLVETGFLSNREEDRLLATSGYRKKVARGIADGVTDFFSLKD